MFKSGWTVTALAALGPLLLLAGPASADTTRTFQNSAPIAIPASGSVGAAQPYPSSIEVSGMTGPVREAKLTLHDFGHERPIDVGVLLVSPWGGSFMVMHRRCGFTAVEDKTWTFTAFALNPQMPADGPCDGSFYRASSSAQGSWPLPAPGGPHQQDFGHLIGAQTNGTWSIYVADFAFDKVGDIEGGWSLELTTVDVDTAVPGAGTAGPASPYPAVRTVSGADGVITDLDVFLPGVSHQRPQDLDLLLVGPRGQKLVLMSDSCGTVETRFHNWHWDDEGVGPMPSAVSCGFPAPFYWPTNSEGGGDNWPSPAPPGPYAVRLSAFDLTDPNGDWRLFVNDDSSGAIGFTLDRFGLDISTRPKARVAFSERAVELAEGTNRSLTLRRLAATEPGAGAVRVSSRPMTATSGSDFTPVSTIVDFAAGETEKTVRIDALTDAARESPETFAVAIDAPQGDAATGTPSTVAVTIPGQRSGRGGLSVGDRTAPVLSSFRASPRRFRRRKGTSLTLALSEPASVRFDVQRMLAGRRVEGRCRKLARANRSRRRCTRLSRRGSMTRARPAGRSNLAFSGRIGGRALRPGRYKLRATPTDAAGNTGRPRSVRISVVR